MNTVLVVDDDHDIRVTLREALEAEGLLVFSAANGVEGMAVLSKIKPPALILLDQNMPLMDGDAFLDIKAKEENLAPIPVVVMSAVKDHPLHSGAREFIGKPFDLNRMIEMVKRYCQGAA